MLGRLRCVAATSQTQVRQRRKAPPFSTAWYYRNHSQVAHSMYVLVHNEVEARLTSCIAARAYAAIWIIDDDCHPRIRSLCLWGDTTALRRAGVITYRRFRYTQRNEEQPSEAKLLKTKSGPGRIRTYDQRIMSPLL